MSDTGKKILGGLAVGGILVVGLAVPGVVSKGVAYMAARNAYDAIIKSWKKAPYIGAFFVINRWKTNLNNKLFL